MADYIPPEDAACLAWLKNFSQHLSAEPAAYAVSDDDAANIAARVDAYETAFNTANNESTRNAGTVLVKDQTKAVAVRLARTFAGQIKLNEGVTDDAKTLAGVPLPRTGGGTPVPPPTSAPTLSIVGAAAGSQTINFRDNMNPAPRAKPYGVKALQLFVAVGETAATDPGTARYQGQYGRGPIGVPFDAADDGKIATYFARWISTRNDEGPWSNPQSMRIAA